MEQAQPDLCGLCEAPFEATSLKTQLPCLHTFHTACMIEEHAGFFCTICDEDHSFVDHAEGEGSATREEILKLYDDSEPFRKALKAYVDATKACSKPRKALADLTKQKKAEVSVRYAQIHAELEALYETKKDEIMSSEAYKTYSKVSVKQRNRYAFLRRNFLRYLHRLSDLREKPGLKTLRPFWLTHNWRPITFVRRAVRFRWSRY